MARYFISSFNNSYFFSSYNGLSARLYQINLCKERFIIKLRWPFKVPFLNPCKVEVCCPVAINCPKAETIQNPIVMVICNHGAKALQWGVSQSFFKSLQSGCLLSSCMDLRKNRNLSKSSCSCALLSRYNKDVKGRKPIQKPKLRVFVSAENCQQSTGFILGHNVECSSSKGLRSDSLSTYNKLAAGENLG